MADSNRNGGVDILAQAIRKVFRECMDESRKDVKEELDVKADEVKNIVESVPSKSVDGGKRQ